MAAPPPPQGGAPGMPNFSKFTLTAMQDAEISTGFPAVALLKQTGLLPTPPPGSKILDNACGAGVVAKRLFENLPASASTDTATFELVCGDDEPAMLAMTSDTIAAKKWANVRAARLDAHSTAFPDGHFTHVLMNFGPQLMRDAEAALAETYRITRPGGTIGFTCWVKNGALRSVGAVFPDFRPPGLLQASPWREAEAIRGILRGVGFEEGSIEVEEFEFTDQRERVDGFLEVMGLLMSGLLHGENMRNYEAYIRGELEKGPLELTWQALIVSARKL